MAKSARDHQQCPGHPTETESSHKPRLAVCLQLSTVGEAPRRRARAETIYLCDDCVRVIKTKSGRPLRRAIWRAIQSMARQIPHAAGHPKVR